MRTFLTLVAIFGLIVLVGCTSCRPDVVGAADVVGNECGKPVYQGPNCPELPEGVKNFFGDLHERVFKCNPDVPGAAACD